MERGRARAGGRTGGGRGGGRSRNHQPWRTNAPGEGSAHRNGGRGPTRGWSEVVAGEGSRRVSADQSSAWRRPGGSGEGAQSRPAEKSTAGEGSMRVSADQSSAWSKPGGSGEGSQSRPAEKFTAGEGSGEGSSRLARPSEAMKPDTYVSGIQVSKAVNQLAPVQRPDKCGTTSVRRVRLRVNHFLVRYNADTVIMHYDMDVKPETPPKGNDRPVRIPKPDLSMIRDKLFSDKPAEFPMSKTAYDGEKNIFSAVRLPTGKFGVEISKGEDTKSRFYTVRISLINELKLGKLSDYLRGCPTVMPREILHGMNVVMNENPTREMIAVGRRSFYSKVPDPNGDLGHGISAHKGFLHSLKPTSQGLSLCLDSSVLAFRKRMPVLEFLGEHIDGFNLKQFYSFEKEVKAALKGLKVYVNHRRTSQKFVVKGLTNTARNSAFDMVDPDGKAPPKSVLLVDYFKEKYERAIRYVDIPCLDLGKNKRNDVPMEFCELVEGQRYNKERLDRNGAQTLKALSLPQPSVRVNTISNMVKSESGPCGGGIARNFGIDVNMNMTAVEGRVIGPPELKLGGPNGKMITVTVDRDKCHWNLVGKSVVVGKPIDKWAVLDFRQNERYNYFDLDPDAFIPKLIARCGKLGIRMSEPLFYQATSMRKFSSVDKLRQLLEGVAHRDEIRGDRLQLLVCSMNRKDPGYKLLKWICETEIGIVTQCCLSNLATKANDQYLANLVLKINAKLGGSNVELTRQPVAALGSGHVMFVGADVNHPTGVQDSAKPASPSIAAVVASLNWPASNRYAARVRSQCHLHETIDEFGNMCLELVESFARQNKARPEKIVIFRDGVSESQFEMVLNKELLDLRRAFAAVKYSPTITLVVAQKRHQTRLFPQSKDDGCSTGNVPPGTVVDTRVVHPFEFDFYLCSHYGSLGTSKPTHYHVLYDEHSFTSDQMQKLVYDMCFTMARCTKPVSLVPPVYYADLVAYRGRLYYEALTECHGTSSTQGSSSSSSVALSDKRFSKPHADLENEMFFV